MPKWYCHISPRRRVMQRYHDEVQLFQASEQGKIFNFNVNVNFNYRNLFQQTAWHEQKSPRKERKNFLSVSAAGYITLLAERFRLGSWPETVPAWYVLVPRSACPLPYLCTTFYILYPPPQSSLTLKPPANQSTQYYPLSLSLSLPLQSPSSYHSSSLLLSAQVLRMKKERKKQKTESQKAGFTHVLTWLEI